MDSNIAIGRKDILSKEYFGEESPYIIIENGYHYRNLQDVEPEQQLNGNDQQLKAVILSRRNGQAQFFGKSF